MFTIEQVEEILKIQRDNLNTRVTIAALNRLQIGSFAEISKETCDELIDALKKANSLIDKSDDEIENEIIDAFSGHSYIYYEVLKVFKKIKKCREAKEKNI